jgi:hypothetical protein
MKHFRPKLFTGESKKIWSITSLQILNLWCFKVDP